MSSKTFQRIFKNALINIQCLIGPPEEISLFSLSTRLFNVIKYSILCNP